MPDILDFGTAGMKKSITMVVLAYFALATFKILPADFVTGKIVGVPYATIAAVGAALSVYWLAKRLIMP